MSRASNYVCEPVARVFALISAKRQQENATGIDYFEYAKNNIGMELILQATASGFSKNIFSDQAGAFFGNTGIFTYLKSFYIARENQFISYTIGQNGGELLYDRMHSISQASDVNIISKFVVGTGVIALDFVFKSLYEIITTYLLAPTARIAQDSVGYLVKELVASF